MRNFGVSNLLLVSICILYIECTNAGVRYENIVSGMKQAALGNVKNQQAKDFICVLDLLSPFSHLSTSKTPFYVWH